LPDVGWILERVMASVQGTLELHQRPEPGWVVNDNSADGGIRKAAA
jgi:hypothetical protein